MQLASAQALTSKSAEHQLAVWTSTRKSSNCYLTKGIFKRSKSKTVKLLKSELIKLCKMPTRP